MRVQVSLLSMEQDLYKEFDGPRNKMHECAWNQGLQQAAFNKLPFFCHTGMGYSLGTRKNDIQFE